MAFAISQPKNSPTATKRKGNISIELKASSVTIRFHLGLDIDLGFSRSDMEFAISQPKMVRLPWNEKQTYWLNSRPQMLPSGLTLDVTLKGKVTRVTSDVGLPLTRLVFLYQICFILITIPLKFVWEDPIINNPALVHIMAGHWTGNKPLPEPMVA